MSKIDKLLVRLEEVTDELWEKNNTTLGYKKTLNFLLASKTKATFLKRYQKQIDDGYDSIEDLDFNPELITLEELKLLAIETVIEYIEAYLEEDDDDDCDMDDDDDYIDDRTPKEYDDDEDNN